MIYDVGIYAKGYGAKWTHSKWRLNSLVKIRLRTPQPMARSIKETGEIEKYGLPHHKTGLKVEEDVTKGTKRKNTRGQYHIREKAWNVICLL